MNKGVVAIAIVGLFLSGCVISIDGDGDNSHHGSWSKIEKQNRQHISELAQGNTVSNVRSKMGTPEFDELIIKNQKSV